MALGFNNPLSSDSPAKAEGLVLDIGVTDAPFRWDPANATVPVGTTEGCFDARIGPCTFDTGAGRANFLREGTAKLSFDYTFDKPGVYPFYCRLHGAPGGARQFGTIVVYEPGKSPPQ